MSGGMRGKHRRPPARPMKNALYPVYPEDRPRIIDALKSRLKAFEGERDRSPRKEGQPETERDVFVDGEIRAHYDLLKRLEDQ